MPTFIHSVIGDQVHLAQSVSGIRFEGAFRSFRPEIAFQYLSYGDDFGPLNLSSIIEFIRALDQEIANHPDAMIVFCIDEGRRMLTNAVCLLGSYMILKLGFSPATVMASFHWLDPSHLTPYRDATFLKADFDLLLDDCFCALFRSQTHGWVRYAARGYMWGSVDVDEYRHYDQPANGDVHQLIPGKLIALQSPKDLDGAAFCDGPDGSRTFSPAYMADLLLDLGAATLVRLNQAQYNTGPVEARGIRVVDLPCPDGGRPPDAVIAAFIRTVDAAPGAVAVHCATGRDQTATLAALYLMRAHGVTAREAMGWLRIVRPGSVVGDQQRFLCEVGAALCRLRSRTGSGEPATDLGAPISAAPPSLRGALEPVPECAEEEEHAQ